VSSLHPDPASCLPFNKAATRTPRRGSDLVGRDQATDVALTDQARSVLDALIRKARPG
jgi:hypothetical protein